MIGKKQFIDFSSIRVHSISFTLVKSNSVELLTALLASFDIHAKVAAYNFILIIAPG